MPWVMCIECRGLRASDAVPCASNAVPLCTGCRGWCAPDAVPPLSCPVEMWISQAFPMCIECRAYA